MAPKTIIITGASRGIGLAIATYLSPTSNLILLSRSTPEPLLSLQKAHSSSIRLITGDLGTEYEALATKAVETAEKEFGGLDGVVVNHGILGDAARIENADLKAWELTLHVNFLSVVAFAKSSLPLLRKSHGRLIFTSSGAAMKGTSTWGIYGATKAAMNHLAMTLGNEEPDVVTVSVRPGMVATQMQADLREKYVSKMKEAEGAVFVNAHKEGTLLRPEQPGNVMARLVLGAGKELSGKFVNWNDTELLKDFQD